MAGTIQQIAELAGVSRGTVDRALNNRGRINPEVAKKIEQIASEIGYVPKHRKKADSAGKQGSRGKRIGVVTQLSQSSFMLQVNKGIRDAAKKLADQGMEVIIKENASVDESEQMQAITELEEAGIDGLVVMPVDCDNVRVKLNALTEERNIPVVTFNSDIVGTKRCCFVGLDNWKSGRTAAGLMGMMMRGKGKVLVITGYFSNSAGSRRVDGFVEELKRSFPEMDLVGVQSSFDHTDEVEKIIVNAMSAFPDLEGIFVASGGQAGVRKAFDKLMLEKRPYVIIYDLTPKNEKALLEDTVDFLIDQEGYDQGYRALSILSDLLRRGRMPEKEYMYTEINIKTKYNLN